MYGVYEFGREWEHQLLLKSVAPALTFTPPPKCFVVFICLPSDNDSIPPPSASAPPLPKCLADRGRTFYLFIFLCSSLPSEARLILSISKLTAHFPILSSSLLCFIAQTYHHRGEKRETDFFPACQRYMGKLYVKLKTFLRMLSCDSSHKQNPEMHSSHCAWKHPK